jgi:hypothetical protein
LFNLVEVAKQFGTWFSGFERETKKKFATAPKRMKRNTVETGYTAGIWGHHEHPRYKLTVL